MNVHEATGRHGGFATDRFHARRRAWRRRHWWAFPIVLLIPLAIELPIALLTHSHQTGFWIGVGIGAGIGASMVFFDLPPPHIENWRTGAEGERATARAVRPLVKQGWIVFNDIPTGHGNLDHVLVGPAGVFVLESKRLSGLIRVEPGKLIISHLDDPTDVYENHTIGSRARRDAARLHSWLCEAGTQSWVQPVVVLWSNFARVQSSATVRWVQGKQLAGALGGRPIRYSEKQLNALAAKVQSAVALRSS